MVISQLAYSANEAALAIIETAVSVPEVFAHAVERGSVYSEVAQGTIRLYGHELKIIRISNPSVALQKGDLLVKRTRASGMRTTVEIDAIGSGERLIVELTRSTSGWIPQATPTILSDSRIEGPTWKALTDLRWARMMLFSTQILRVTARIGNSRERFTVFMLPYRTSQQLQAKWVRQKGGLNLEVSTRLGLRNTWQPGYSLKEWNDILLTEVTSAKTSPLIAKRIRVLCRQFSPARRASKIEVSSLAAGVYRADSTFGNGGYVISMWFVEIQKGGLIPYLAWDALR